MLSVKHTVALAADTELVGDADLEAVEERLQAPADGGVALEPFNLEQERAEGFFDEEGHYVEKKDEEERDAWLASGEGARVRRGRLPTRHLRRPGCRGSPAENHRRVVFCSALRCARGMQRHGRLCTPSSGADQAPRPRLPLTTSARARGSGGGQRARAPPDRRARARDGGR